MNSSDYFLSNEQLIDVLSLTKTATAIHVTEDAIIQLANEAMLRVWDKDSSVIGKTLEDALPELKGQPFIDMFKRVWNEGLTISGTDTPADLMIDGTLTTVYFDFEYRAIKDAAGKTICILHTATDITERFLGQQAIELAAEREEALFREQALNEELASANEELASANEELSAINDELQQTQENLYSLNVELEERVFDRTLKLVTSQEALENLNSELKRSETWLDQILSQLPAPVVVLEGPDQVITTTNEALLSFWDKTRDEVLGKPMLEVFPELRSQPFPAQWKHVLNTGEIIVNREKPVIFNKANGTKRLYYVDYHYQPLKDTAGKLVSVLATVIDVTDKVLSRQQVEQAENKLRMAIEASQLGTWYFDVNKGEYVFSARLKEIFGFYAHEEMTNELATKQITDEYRDEVIRTVNEAIINNTNYELEYAITGFHDKQLRWVKATGKLYAESGNNPANFSGIVMDITDQKLEEQRKDDFISIASHELKTPTTALKASLQLLDRMKDKPSPIFPRLIEQANRSIDKITILIDELLNSTRTTEGQLHLTRSVFNVANMLNECCNHVRVAGKHELIFKGDPELEVYADEHRIDQVIVNLVNNAVKYAPDSREIYLIVEKAANNMAKISVKDSGPGIPADKIEHLFDRYYRADYAGSQYSGLGLGLYISSEIVKRHGGEIGVDSELGHGSTFWFTLPVA
ncbi:ATP-binding protein [Mucilaginibacter agri]|uniref:histidine kinase n=1 Tax=Mucilaginibacter agri TaxID=2695265 RepID=A0A966DUN7_9SPHI|nr:ATP-binding protein [Mucilaginibacter agri]NCD71950.1 PAS domain-containing protein [Mucilaginibacter agri]